MRVCLATRGQGSLAGTRNATKSGSSPEFPFNVRRLKDGMIQDVPDASRKRAQTKWGVPGEYPHDSAVSVFGNRYLHAARAQMRQDGNHLSTLGMSCSSTIRTLFSMKSNKRFLTSSHHVFAGANKSPIAREAEKSLMLRHQTHSAMGLRNVLIMSSEWRSCGQARNVSIYVVDELHRVISVPRFMMPMVVPAVYVCNKILGLRDGRLQRQEI